MLQFLIKKTGVFYIVNGFTNMMLGSSFPKMYIDRTNRVDRVHFSNMNLLHGFIRISKYYDLIAVSFLIEAANTLRNENKFARIYGYTCVLFSYMSMYIHAKTDSQD